MSNKNDPWVSSVPDASGDLSEITDLDVMNKHYQCSLTLDFENVLSEEEAIAEFLDYCRNDASFDSIEVSEASNGNITDYVVLVGDEDEMSNLHVNCTDEGVIIDLYSPNGDLLGTWARTAQELAERLFEDGE